MSLQAVNHLKDFDPEYYPLFSFLFWLPLSFLPRLCVWGGVEMTGLPLNVSEKPRFFVCLLLAILSSILIFSRLIRAQSWFSGSYVVLEMELVCSAQELNPTTH